MLSSWSAARACVVVACCSLAMSGHALGATLAAKAKAEGCTGKPSLVQGTSLYKCTTQGGMHYFNLESAVNEGAPSVRGGSVAPPPQGFPKVDTATQKGRDAVRRKVLTDELAVEEKLLAEAKGEYGNGAPPATQEEKDVPKKYADRLTKLRQTIALHEKNIEALKKELAATR